jgi:sarcosine oxidase gamma subunit
MARMLFLAAALMAACGGSSSSGSDLDPGFSGTWTGPATLTISGQTPQSYTARLVIAAAGQTATFSDVCFDGSGSITIHGSGRSATWSGSYACPPVAFTNCSSVTETFQSASVVLNGKALSAQGSGTASGCGLTKDFTITMTGSKT